MHPAKIFPDLGSTLECNVGWIDGCNHAHDARLALSL